MYKENNDKIGALLLCRPFCLVFPQDIGASPVIIGKAIAESEPAGRRVFAILVGGGEENFLFKSTKKFFQRYFFS